MDSKYNDNVKLKNCIYQIENLLSEIKTILYHSKTKEILSDQNFIDLAKYTSESEINFAKPKNYSQINNSISHSKTQFIIETIENSNSKRSSLSDSFEQKYTKSKIIKSSSANFNNAKIDTPSVQQLRLNLINRPLSATSNRTSKSMSEYKEVFNEEYEDNFYKEEQNNFTACFNSTPAKIHANQSSSQTQTDNDKKKQRLEIYRFNLMNNNNNNSSKITRNIVRLPKYLQKDEQDDIKIIIGYNQKGNMFHLFDIGNLCISENSTFNLFWNMLITVQLGQNMILFPLENFSESWLNELYWQIFVQMFFEWVFIFDIMINFITSQKDQQGRVVKNPQLIALNQLSTWFLIDLISSVPSENISRFQNTENSSQNLQLRMLKLPKQTRIVKGMLNMFSSRLNMLSIDSIITFTTTETKQYINFISYFFLLILLSNGLVCFLISFTGICIDYRHCSNWFVPMMQKEFHHSLNNDRSWWYSKASQLNSLTEDIDEAEILFQNWAVEDRKLLYLNAFQFVMQTVTTVGYGDVPTDSSAERIFRTVCMVLGVIMFTILTTRLMEIMITETLNIYKQNEHETMIEKLLIKQSMHGDPKRFLSLLGDSVQIENMEKELDFVGLLPKYMSESVLKYIWNIQQNKMHILKEESLSFFIMMMRVSCFRRCVFDEIIESGEKRVSILYSGQIGCFVSNLREYLFNDQLYYVEVGEELGYQCYLDLPNSNQNNYMYICTVNSELVEIKATDFVIILQKSLKGIEQVENCIIDYLVELYIMVAVQYSMLKLGLQIDYKWQNKTMALLEFEPYDFFVMKMIQTKFNERLTNNLPISREEKENWYGQFVDADVKKQIKMKIKNLEDKLILEEFVQFLNLNDKTRPNMFNNWAKVKKAKRNSKKTKIYSSNNSNNNSSRLKNLRILRAKTESYLNI